MRYVIIAVFLLALNPSVKPEGGNSQGKDKSNGERESPVVVVHNEVSTREPSHDSKETPEWYASIDWANWALVIVGGLTAFAVWRQVQESAAATNAMRESIKLQEAGMQQWVDVETRGLDAPSISLFSNPQTEVRFRFEAINNTSYPLTIKKIVTRLSVLPDECNIVSVSTQAILPPAQKRSPVDTHSLPP